MERSVHHSSGYAVDVEKICPRKDMILQPLAYQASALPIELREQQSEVKELNLLPSVPKTDSLPMT